MAIEITRDYRMLDSELYSFASDLCQRMTRDIAELGFGITNATITALQALTDAFEAIPSDDGLLGDLMLATQTKNELAEQLRENIRSLALHIQLKWGTNSPQYRSLGDLSVSKFSDSILHSAADNIHQRMTGYLADLASTGLTQNILDDFLDLIISFQSARNEVTDKIEDRDNTTQERIIKGNELYGLVVNYCEIGKRVYEKTNPAKYNDYIIYNSISPGSLTTPTNLSFYFPTKTISWDAVDNATSYQLQWSVDGEEANYVEIYSGSDTSYLYNEIASPTNFLRTRARNNNGFGDWSDVLIQGYFVTLPPPVILGAEIVPNSSNAVRVVWEEVPSATKYRVYRSTVNIGDPAGSWVLVSQETNTSLIETVGEGKRYYYRLTAENSYQASVVSSSVFVDVPVVP